MKSVGKKYEVNDELIQKLDKGDLKWSDLDPETEAAAGAYLDKLDTSAPETPDAQTIQGEPEIKQEESVTPPKGFVDGKRFKEKADAASDFENKWRSEQRARLELEAKLKAKEQEPIQAPTLDKVWTDEAQIDLHTKFAELQRKVESFEGERKQTLEEARAEKLSAQNETEMQMLRSNPLFKSAIPTEGNLEQIEKVYADFFYATGATAQDATPVKKYFEDTEFRKSLEAKGVKAPKDFEKINNILQVKALRDKYRQVDPDFKMTDAYVSFMAKSNKLPSMFVEERLKGAAEVADKLHGIANETITMTPGLTSGAVQDSWSDAQMLKWMNEHPHPKTKDERATFARIEGILDQRAAQAQQGY
jgi:hypothetical protein